MLEFSRKCPICQNTIYHKSKKTLSDAILHKRNCRRCISKYRILLDQNSGAYDIKKCKWKKQCPRCEEFIFYGSKKSFKSSLKKQSICFACLKFLKQEKYKIYSDDKYDDNSKLWFRICPKCNLKIVYSKYDNYKKAFKRNLQCNTCKIKSFINFLASEESKTKASVRFKKLWNDENSLLRKKECIDKRIESFKKTNATHKEKGTLWYSEEFREENSKRTKLLFNDPVFLAKREAILSSREYKEKLSSGLKKAWKNPNSKFNSIGYKEKAAKRLAEACFKLGLNTSKCEFEVAKALENYGFIHNDFKIKIGKYYPDIINLQEKIIVEFFGDFFHANPVLEKYKNPDIFLNFPKCRRIKIRDIWDRDAEKINTYRNLGYHVFIVWEHDWRSKIERKKILDDIFNFIKNK